MKRVSFGGSVSASGALGSPALGQTPDGRIQAPGLVPAYIKADPAAVTKAFGKPLADKIFSDAYTSVRRQAAWALS